MKKFKMVLILITAATIVIPALLAKRKKRGARLKAIKR